MTESTEIKGMNVTGRIFYDAECALCGRALKLFRRLFESRGFQWIPLQTPGVAKRLGVRESDLWSAMHLESRRQGVVHGVDAWPVLCATVWWLKPFGLLLRLPGVHWAAKAAYGLLARNRYCLGGACRMESPGLRRIHRHAAFFELP
ncbi:MAG: DUF393 domain-containing protein [Verrucomicrobiae bacterium]|jgi:predicted DCC family thiol-disulfide oxidoreductase YuxK|nr:DUF393 domain-containing protein [Verrucomicrobiae bacterium]